MSFFEIKRIRLFVNFQALSEPNRIRLAVDFLGFHGPGTSVFTRKFDKFS